ncbi:RecB family exonuclease [Halofilum ochraceum]|uniref:RecB family exonuclease n=1 Tax=Halofilum ochraceum TaxID=1611323 RepID=UPI001586952C|nr:PD-(D/E)XK nuclease family protein [Halofilum ochraceum]
MTGVTPIPKGVAWLVDELGFPERPDGNVAVRVRASSLAELFDCPARWAAKHLQGESLPDSGRAHLGTAVHHATGLFDQARVEGRTMDPTDAADAFVEAFRADEHVHWFDVKKAEAERTGVGLVALYCQDIAGGFDFDSVELTCEEVEIDMGDGLVLRLTGTLDRIYRDVFTTDEGIEVERRGIADLKTGRAAVDSVGNVKMDWHGAQLAVYELLGLLGQRTTGEELIAPGKIIGLKTEGTPAAGIGTIPDGRGLLLGNNTQTGLLEYAAGIIKSGLWWGNPRSMMCHHRFCPIHNQCRFRSFEETTE